MNYPSLFGLIASVICLVVLLFLGGKVQNPYWKSVWRSALFFFSMYILILIVVFLRFSYFQSELEAFDLNQNGIIDPSEMTEDYKVQTDELYKDSSRNYAFKTGAQLSFLLASMAMGIDLFATYFREKASGIKT